MYIELYAVSDISKIVPFRFEETITILVNKEDNSSFADYISNLCSSYLAFLYACSVFRYVRVCVPTEISVLKQ
jgi:hypothetical protein